MESLESELHRMTIENCKLKASLKAATYEKEKLLELVKNLLTALDNSEAPDDISILKPKNPKTFVSTKQSDYKDEISQKTPKNHDIQGVTYNLSNLR